MHPLRLVQVATRSMDQPEVAVVAGHPLLAPELLVELESPAVHPLRLVQVASRLMDQPEVAVVAGHPLLAAKLLVKLEGPAVHPLRLVQVATRSMNQPEVVVLGGHPLLAAELFVDREGPAVHPLRLVQVAEQGEMIPQLGHPARYRFLGSRALDVLVRSEARLQLLDPLPTRRSAERPVRPAAPRVAEKRGGLLFRERGQINRVAAPIHEIRGLAREQRQQACGHPEHHRHRQELRPFAAAQVQCREDRMLRVPARDGLLEPDEHHRPLRRGADLRCHDLEQVRRPGGHVNDDRAGIGQRFAQFLDRAVALGRRVADCDEKRESVRAREPAPEGAQRVGRFSGRKRTWGAL